MIHTIDKIPVPLPDEAVWRRLGRHRHQAEILPEQRRRIESLMHEAFALCRLRGVYRELAVAEHGAAATRFADGTEFAGVRLAELLAGASAALLLAASAGSGVVDAIREAGENGDGVRALVFDAVAGEAADAAMAWLQRHCDANLRRRGARVTARRISPGYGDLALMEQAKLMRLLELDSRLGIELNEYFIMKPEKSVTALAGVEVIR